jgi:hypothetical protein
MGFIASPFSIAGGGKMFKQGVLFIAVARKTGRAYSR